EDADLALRRGLERLRVDGQRAYPRRRDVASRWRRLTEEVRAEVRLVELRAQLRHAVLGDDALRGAAVASRERMAHLARRELPCLPLEAARLHQTGTLRELKGARAERLLGVDEREARAEQRDRLAARHGVGEVGLEDVGEQAPLFEVVARRAPELALEEPEHVAERGVRRLARGVRQHHQAKPARVGEEKPAGLNRRRAVVEREVAKRVSASLLQRGAARSEDAHVELLAVHGEAREPEDVGGHGGGERA